MFLGPGDKIDIRDTGETFRITGMRSGRTRWVWRTPIGYRWRRRWLIVPWRTACTWSFGGECDEVPQPTRKSERRLETEQFMDVQRGPF